MKGRKRPVLAASMLAFALAGLPHVAAASTGTTPKAGPDLMRKAGGTNCPYLKVLLAGGMLISAAPALGPESIAPL